jgi:hypothetical protein
MPEGSYPRFFVYGTSYLPPSPYVGVENDRAYIVDPRGRSVRVEYPIDYWESREKRGAMVETSREAISNQIERWNQSNSPRLAVPD